jgi:hypothetical protein
VEPAKLRAIMNKQTRLACRKAPTQSTLLHFALADRVGWGS